MVPGFVENLCTPVIQGLQLSRRRASVTWHRTVLYAINFLVAPNEPSLPCRPNLPRPQLISSVLKTEIVRFSETSISTHKTTRLSSHTQPFSSNSSYSFNILRFTKCLSQELFHCKHLIHYRWTLSNVSAALYVRIVPKTGCPVERKINIQ